MSQTDAEGQTVYINRRWSTHAKKVYHTDPDCPMLNQAHSAGSRAVSRDSIYDDATECQYCSDERKWADGGPATFAVENQRTKNGGPPGKSETRCHSCGADKEAGQPCEWCERYEEVMGPYA